jgi:hypothetical protein
MAVPGASGKQFSMSISDQMRTLAGGAYDFCLAVQGGRKMVRALMSACDPKRTSSPIVQLSYFWLLGRQACGLRTYDGPQPSARRAKGIAPCTIGRIFEPHRLLA